MSVFASKLLAGAVCSSAASTDLCGGCQVTGVPTATKIPTDFFSLRTTSSKTFQRLAGRPRAFDRERVIGIALDLFWRQGFEGTSIHQLTLAMGIAPPSLYAAFGSKEDLYREAVELYLSRYTSFMNHFLDEKIRLFRDFNHNLSDMACAF